MKRNIDILYNYNMTLIFISISKKLKLDIKKSVTFHKSVVINEDLKKILNNNLSTNLFTLNI